ncbi:MAG: carbohydrate ABC transporter permease [Caldilineaceae bacterium]|nr:carbohydrate ABC transporter permease [Caldilineaceae bacterium]MDE0461625.1 carbohydrate ABC transporter permease [Caldilineaceae bacterium]
MRANTVHPDPAETASDSIVRTAPTPGFATHKYALILRETGKYILLLFFAVISLMPFVWIVGIALKTKKEFYDAPFSLPAVPQWQNLATAWDIGHFGEFFLNSVIITLPTVVGVLICCSLAGYALAKIDFLGRNILFYFFLAGIIIPFQAIMIPLYYQLRDLGLLTTYMAGILPMIALGIPFGIFLMRAFFMSLPVELIDAAKIDGCGDFGVFWHIMVPLAKPALSTLGIVQFIASWNAFLLPLLYLQKQSLRPLTLGLLYFQTRYESDYTLIAAGITIIILPMILVYVLFQRQFIEGLTSGALKG